MIRSPSRRTNTDTGVQVSKNIAGTSVPASRCLVLIKVNTASRSHTERGNEEARSFAWQLDDACPVGRGLAVVRNDVACQKILRAVSRGKRTQRRIGCLPAAGDEVLHRFIVGRQMDGTQLRQ